MISPAKLDDLMHRGWPGLSTIPIDGWIARMAGGVTQRANSVLPLAAPRNLAAALTEVEALYQESGVPPTFQLSPAAQPADLDAILADRGYERRSSTRVQVAGVGSVLHRVSPSGIHVTIDEEPGEDWMRLWWSIDGRGGPEARTIACRILTLCPALYASTHDDAGATAIGRLALVDGWGGIYCMAVREDVRRRGYAKAVLRSLLQEAANRSIGHAWLQVLVHNQGAAALYARAGFVDVSKYHYRVRISPPSLPSTTRYG